MSHIDYTLPLDQLPDPLPIEPLTKPFDVTITPPGSKSITCRAYVLAALAKGESRIIRPLRSDDTDHLLNALCALGAEAKWVPGDDEEHPDVLITGVGGRFPRGGHLHMGEGGTPTRFMIACACLAGEPVTIDASPRMRERPIAEGVDMLRQLGAKIEYVEQEGRLPVRVEPSEKFVGGELTVGKTASSQFVSAVMLIAPFLRDGLHIHSEQELTSVSYVHLTMESLWNWHGHAEQIAECAGRSYRVSHSLMDGSRARIEPDASSATYWICGAALSGGRAEIPGLPFDSQQPDSQVARSLQPSIYEQWRSGSEWSSNVRWPALNGRLQGVRLDAQRFPDGAMALAVAVSACHENSMLSGLATLRVKETDRIAALATELRKIGCSVETGEDWISIEPPAKDHGRDARATESVVIETYNDHRMAMSFAILGLVRPGISIRNPKCVAKSYPGFWRDFAKLYQ